MEFHNEYDSALSGKYYLAGRRLGAPTSPMTPKQLDEFGKRLNEGIQNVEIGTLDPDKFDTIPQEHFKERTKRLAQFDLVCFGKLTLIFSIGVVTYGEVYRPVL